MLTFYHGTRRADAMAMSGPPGGPGTIDVTRGGGEFGRGFYTQSSPANALTWAQNRFPAQGPCLLEVDIDDTAYAGLNVRQLDRKQALRLTQRLRQQHATGTYLAGVDVIAGPLSGSQWILQQKFESPDAQTLLNGPQTQRRVV